MKRIISILWRPFWVVIPSPQRLPPAATLVSRRKWRPHLPVLLSRTDVPLQWRSSHPVQGVTRQPSVVKSHSMRPRKVHSRVFQHGDVKEKFDCSNKQETKEDSSTGIRICRLTLHSFLGWTSQNRHFNRCGSIDLPLKILIRMGRGSISLTCRLLSSTPVSLGF